MLVELKHIEVRRLPAASLADADASAWRALQAADPVFESPLLGPDFARVVGRHRADAEVAVFTRDDRPVGYLAYHRRPGGFARPIGAPFADYHGLVCAPEFALSGADILGRLDLKAFRHNGLIDPLRRFGGAMTGRDGYLIRLNGDAEAYLDACYAARPKMFKNWRRLARRLGEQAPLRLSDAAEAEAFDQLLRWKSAQFARTGVMDVLRPAWASSLMRELFQTTQGSIRGLMLTLWSGDQLVAGEFGIRSDRVFHPWIAAMNPEMATFSPGAAFTEAAIRAMPGLGLDVMDLGTGTEHSKRPFASETRPAAVGLTIVDGLAGARSRVSEGAWRLGGLDRLDAVGKIQRRLDHIAAVDPSMAGRARGVWEAVGAVRKRLGPEPTT